MRRFAERLGFLPAVLRQPAPGAVWIHAVSVGEVLASVELLRQLRASLPWARVFLSTTTLAGRALADEKLAGLADGVFYSPIDFCFAVRRVLRTLRPALVVVAETEIWPNLYREAKRAGCGLVVVNGRISDKAAPRYRRFAWFFRGVLRWPDWILAQSEVSRERYLALGAPGERTLDAGNLKYDFQPRQSAIPEVIRQWLERTRPSEIWIAASTMPPAFPGDVDEDDAVIGAFRSLAGEHPGLLLLLVPRKPERFDVVAGKLAASGVPFARRSNLEADSPSLPLPGVLLVDSIGELSSLFSLESLVFMGGSLAARGGHNILEPAFYGRSILVGPHMENFAEISAQFSSGGGCLTTGRPEELSGAVGRLLRDSELRRSLGIKARQLVESRRGATGRTVGVLADTYARAVPHFRPVFPMFQIRWTLSQLWRAGANGRRRRYRNLQSRLATPVISVGSLSMGGSGKTPFVLWLAERLRQRGLRPAILTRGYRRRAPEPVTVLEAGAKASVARTGDEAQLLLRSGVAPVGIGADRAAVGRAVEERFHPDVFLLDDGFQHHRLARDFDIVLVDALDPFGGGDMFPLGRLREPPESLARAGVFVITRTEPGRAYTGIEERLRAFNPLAPVFKSGVKPEQWIECDGVATFDPARLPLQRVAAFCGLANPAAFWRTLDSLGIQPLARWGFGDHHRYRPVELRRLAAHARLAGAEALVTTEKDAMNLCDHVPGLISPLRLFYLRIGLEVEDGDGLVEALTGTLNRL